MDMISRQAAIEPKAISEWKKEFREYVDSLDITRDDWKGIIEYIDEIPSAQPEHTETHSCENQRTETHDLVSRQSAIDSVCEVCENCEYFKNEKLIQTIKDLPSAQPTQNNTHNALKSLDCIYRQDAIDLLEELETKRLQGEVGLLYAPMIKGLKKLPSAQPESRREWYMKGYRDAQPKWIPIKWHDCTAEEREEYGFGEEIVAVFDCDMPSDNQGILVTTSHGYVEEDICYIDDGYSLDSGYDWIEDITAWMPIPEPYKAESEDKK